MIFYSSPFIYLLSAASILFWLIPGQRLRTWFIITTSAAALFWVQPAFTAFLIALIIGVYFTARLLLRHSHLGIFVAVLVALTAILLGFKYADSIYQAIFPAESNFAKSYLIPLGISYLSFKLIAFVMDIYRNEIKSPRLEDLLAFILFLPIFAAGPIERFQRFTGGRREYFDLEHYMGGILRIAQGIFKKIVIVNFLLQKAVFVHLEPLATAGFDASAIVIIAFLVGALLYGYFDLSSYADIAIGFGQLFGYQVYEDMNYPLWRPNLSEYWNSWHMSLSHWCRNYVYFPVIGWSRNNEIALYSSFIVMGLWHAVSLKWLLWGLWHASGITVYSRWSRWKKKKTRDKATMLPKPVAFTFGIVLTVIYSGLGFAFITQPTTLAALKLLAAIFI